MTGTKLQAAEHLVDELGPGDRVRLLRYLAPRIAEPAPGAAVPSADAAWRRFREVGARLAAGSAREASLTQAVSDMRR